MRFPRKRPFRVWFERNVPCAALAAAPIARVVVAEHREPIPLSELPWALGAIAVWSIVIGAYFAIARAQRRRAARERIRSLQITRYVDLTRKPSAAPSAPDNER
ncbi:MAG: hypothetical protein WAU33_05190 [Candidatus Binataceae bacterium]